MTAAMQYERARIKYGASDYRGAIRELTAVVDETPDHVASRLLLARAYYHAAQLAPAERELREVLASDPTETYAHLMMARTLERQSRPDEAMRHRRILAAMTGDDDHLVPHAALAITL